MADWARLRLAEIAHIAKGRVLPTSSTPLRSSVRYLGATDLEGGNSGLFAPTRNAVLCDEDDVLMLWDGERSGLVGRGLSGAASSTVARIRPLQAKVVSRYLYHYLRSRYGDIQALRTGTGVPHVPRDLQFLVKLPVPLLEEQWRIAEVLDTIDETIHATERVIAKLRATMEGLVAGAVEGARRAGGVRSLGEIADGSPGSLIQTGPFGSQLQASEYVKEGIPTFMPTDIIDGNLAVAGAAKISTKKADELRRHRLQAGDVLFARRGDLKRCAIVAAEQSGGLCGTGCLLVRISEAALSPDWLATVYRHDVVQKQVLARAVGSTMLNLSAGLMRSLLIPGPTQASRRLMKAARENARRIEVNRADLAKLRQIRAGLSADLLSGRVRTVAA